MARKWGRKSKVETEEIHGEIEKEEKENAEGMQGDVLTGKKVDETRPEKTRDFHLRERETAVEPVSKKVDALQSGQKYFEAPDGTLVIGEESQQQLWYRKGNHGKGMWINPKR